MRGTRAKLLRKEARVVAGENRPWRQYIRTSKEGMICLWDCGQMVYKKFKRNYKRYKDIQKDKVVTELEK